MYNLFGVFLLGCNMEIENAKWMGGSGCVWALAVAVP